MPDELLVPIAVAIWMLCSGGLAWAAVRLLSRQARAVRILAALGFPLIVNALILAALFIFSVREQERLLSSAQSQAARRDGSISIRPPDPAAVLRSQVSGLSQGLVAFNPPTEMTVGNHELVSVRIMRGLIDKFSKQPLHSRPAPQIEEVRVGNFMRARLFGEGFEITTHSDESQAVADNDFAEWLYDVLPTKSGDRTLTLQIAIRYKLASSEEITNLPVLTRDISVQVNPWWTATTFVSTNWQWFFGGIGGLVVSIGGFFGKRWFEKRSGASRGGYVES